MPIVPFLLLWLLAGPAAAQALPPGGYLLHQVAALRPTPAEGQQLVPYRRGPQWGYADTTGRLVVAPFADYLPLFQDGLVRIQAKPPYVAAATREHPHYWRDYLLLNAQGEYLLVRYPHFAAPSSDGRWQVHTPAETERQPALLPWQRRWLLGQPQRPEQSGRLSMQQLLATLDTANRRRVREQLGHGYFGEALVLKSYTTRGHDIRTHNTYGPLALMDSTTRLLTPHRYRALADLSEGHLWYAPAGPRWVDDNDKFYPEPNRFGVLNVRRRQVTAARFRAYSPFRRGVATVQLRHLGRLRWAVLDTAGRFTLRPQAEPLSHSDEAGLVRRLHATPAGPVVQFLTAAGRLAFADLGLSDAGPVWGGRAWARVDSLQGLLDARGRWVLPCRYTGLWYSDYQPFIRADKRRQHNDFEAGYATHLVPPDRSSTDQVRPDTALLIARRNGRYGLVSRHSGREVVPCRYDSVLAVHAGYGSFRRQGQVYFVNPQGRELAQGVYYEGDYYDFPRGRFYRVYSAPRQFYYQTKSRWTVLDAQGRQQLPWQEAEGHFLPQGWALVNGGYDTPCFNDACPRVVDAAGRVLFETRGSLTYGVLPYGELGIYGLHHRNLPAAPVRPDLHVFLHRRPDGRQELLDTTFRAITPAYSSLTWAHDGWFVGSYRDDDQAFSTLFRLQGHSYLLPGLQEWNPNAFWGLSSPFTEQGVTRSPKGYVTRGGRHLWEE
ncbi:MAG: WG repeat-containing protein [Janthinobacterium lividum]